MFPGTGRRIRESGFQRYMLLNRHVLDRFQVQWDCKSCSTIRNAGDRCVLCGTPRPKPSSEESDWEEDAESHPSSSDCGNTCAPCPEVIRLREKMRTSSLSFHSYTEKLEALCRVRIKDAFTTKFELRYLRSENARLEEIQLMAREEADQRLITRQDPFNCDRRCERRTQALCRELTSLNVERTQLLERIEDHESIFEAYETEQEALRSDNAKLEEMQLMAQEDALRRSEISALRRQVLYLMEQSVAMDEENARLRAQSGKDRQEIEYLRSMFAPEYDYDEIKSRLDPIRDELKITQRIFGRIIRNRYAAPVAIAVPLGGSDYFIAPTWNSQK